MPVFCRLPFHREHFAHLIFFLKLPVMTLDSDSSKGTNFEEQTPDLRPFLQSIFEVLEEAFPEPVPDHPEEVQLELKTSEGTCSEP